MSGIAAVYNSQRTTVKRKSPPLRKQIASVKKTSLLEMPGGISESSNLKQNLQKGQQNQDQDFDQISEDNEEVKINLSPEISRKRSIKSKKKFGFDQESMEQFKQQGFHFSQNSESCSHDQEHIQNEENAFGKSIAVKTKKYSRNSLFIFKDNNIFRKVVIKIIEWKILELSLGGGTVRLKSLRVLRVLRPLRSINVIPSMRKLVGALLQALPDFVHVAVFLIFIFVLFAILGVHQFNGVIYNRCRTTLKPINETYWEIDLNNTRICSQNDLGRNICPSNQVCGNPADFNFSLESDMIGLNNQINFGITSFDHIGEALLTVFQIITTDDWVRIMLNLMDADMPILAAFYCIFIVIVGSFFLMNLILAVIIQAFIKISRQEIQDEIMQMDEMKLIDINMHQNENQTKKVKRKDKEDQDQIASKNIAENTDRINAFQKKKIQINEINYIQSQQTLDKQKQDISLIGESLKNQLDHMQQDRKAADFSFLRKVNVQNKVLNLFTNNINNSFRRDSVGSIDSPSNRNKDFESPKFLLDSQKKNALHSSAKTLINNDESFNDQFENSNSRIQDKNQKQSLVPHLPTILQKNSNIYHNSPTKDSEDFKISVHMIDKSSILEDLNDQEIGSLNEQGENQSISISEQMLNKKDRIQEEIPCKQKKFTDFPQKNQESNCEAPIQSSNLQNAFRKFLDQKKDEAYSKEQYFNKILNQTKQDYIKKKTMNAQSNLRTLAQQKLGIKVKRQKGNLFKEVEKFKIEDRAESNKCYSFCYGIAKNIWFTRIISILIVINTIDLSMDRYPINPKEEDILEIVNQFLSLIFVLEMIIKILAVGLKAYFKDPFNIFDSVVVLSSIIDFFVQNFISQDSGGGAITALRAFRLIRVFKLAKSWKRFQNLLKTMGMTLKDISTFSILLFLFMFTYSLLGMEIFAYKALFMKDGQLTEEFTLGKSPPTNFDTFFEAITTVFIILTNDGWSGIYYNYFRASGGIVSTFYFISLIVIGQKILLNLFLAILLENFDEESLNQEIKNQIKASKETANQKNIIQIIFTKIKQIFKCFKKSKKASLNLGSLKAVDYSLDDGDNLKIENENDGSMTEKKLIDEEPKQILRKASPNKFMKKEENQIYGISFLIFDQTNWFRKYCFKFVTNKKFDYFIIFFILISAIQLAIENPLNDPQGSLIQVLFLIDLITTIIFSIEALMKMIAMGFLFNGQKSYLRNFWNSVDFIIIVFSIIALTPLSNAFKIVKMFRVARVFRLISKNEGLQVAVRALVSAIPQILSVMVIMALFFVIFGIIGISYFKGKFYYCTNDYLEGQFPNKIFVSHKWDCENFGGIWTKKPYSFDNIFSAMKTLFLMATTSGWSEIMFTSTSSTEIDYVPIQDNSPYWIFFFIAFIIVGAFFLLNLFVGVVISTFNREKDRIGGNNLLTDRQKEWIDTKLIALQAKPIKLFKAPNNKFRKLCFIIQQNKWMDRIIFGCIVVNTLTLMLKWYNQPIFMQTSTDAINQIFTAVFTLEAMIKLFGLGKQYFSDSWNVFDFIIVLGSLISVLLQLLSGFSLGAATTIIRAFRILRIFRLVKRAKNLKLVFNTFIFTLPALVNVGGLLLLLLYLYSILGVYLFSEVKRNGIITEVFNYESFGNAFITLFAVATGDGWGEIMQATVLVKSPKEFCINSPSYQDYVNNGMKPIGCGGDYGSAYVYYYSYFLLVNLIFLNLFIAIVLQGFDETQQKDNRLFNQDTLDKFREIWSRYDPDASTFIQIFKLKELLFDLGQPLGYDESMKENVSEQEKFIASLDLPIYNNFSDYQFLDVLEALALRLVVEEQLMVEKEKKKKEKEVKDSILDDDKSEGEANNTLEKEREIKKQIVNDINKLEFQEDTLKIQKVKEVEQRKRRASNVFGTILQDKHFTSLHQTAAQVAVSHMKYIVAKRKLMKQINQYNLDVVENNQNDSQIKNFNEECLEQNKSDRQTIQQNNQDQNKLQNQQTAKSLIKQDLQQIEEVESSDTSQQSSSSKTSSMSQSDIADQQNDKILQEEVKEQVIKQIYQNLSINTKIINKAPLNLPLLQISEEDNKNDSSIVELSSARINQIIEQEINRSQKQRASRSGTSSSQHNSTPIQDDLLHPRNSSSLGLNTNGSRQRINKASQSSFRNQEQVQISSSPCSQERRSQNKRINRNYDSAVIRKKKKNSIKFGGSVGGTCDWDFSADDEENKNVDQPDRINSYQLQTAGLVEMPQIISTTFVAQSQPLELNQFDQIYETPSIGIEQLALRSLDKDQLRTINEETKSQAIDQTSDNKTGRQNSIVKSRFSNKLKLSISILSDESDKQNSNIDKQSSINNCNNNMNNQQNESF